MNENASPPTPDVPEQSIPNRGSRQKWKVVVAFFLGVLSFPLLFLLGEGVGELLPERWKESFIHVAIFVIGTGGYFLISQYLLSRRNPQAVRKDLPIIVAMNFTPFCMTIVVLLVEPNKGNALQMLLVTILTVACSYAGAALAARGARHRLSTYW
jgi:hypothetical protein